MKPSGDLKYPASPDELLTNVLKQNHFHVDGPVKRWLMNYPFGVKGSDFMLKDVSQIKLSGGCEVFAEGSIIFAPLGQDKATVRVDNTGRWFYDGHSDPIPSFEINVYTKQ